MRWICGLTESDLLHVLSLLEIRLKGNLIKIRAAVLLNTMSFTLTMSEMHYKHTSGKLSCIKNVMFVTVY